LYCIAWRSATDSISNEKFLVLLHLKGRKEISETYIKIMPLYFLQKVTISYSKIAERYKLPTVNFINVICARFLYEHHFGSFYYVHVTREKLLKQRSYKKFACITLMKLTPSVSVIFTNHKDSPKKLDSSTKKGWLISFKCLIVLLF